MSQVTVAEKPQISRPEPPADRREFDWAAAGWAGFVGGAALLLMEMLLRPLVMGGTPMDFVRMVAAMAMGESVLPEPGRLTTLVFVGAMAFHLPLSLLYSRILAGIIHRWHPGAAVAFGVLFGAALYAVNFHLLIGLFPWFVHIRDWVTVMAHLVYGGLVALVYKELIGPRKEWHRFMGRNLDSPRRKQRLDLGA